MAWQRIDDFYEAVDADGSTRVDNGNGVQQVTSMPGYRFALSREPELWDEGLIDL
jgi:hypothetical protein